MNMKFLTKEITTKKAMSLVAVIAFAVLVAISIYVNRESEKISGFGGIKTDFYKRDKVSMEKFKSEEDFKEYVEVMSGDYYSYGFGGDLKTLDSSAPAGAMESRADSEGPSRLSTTDVQAEGIDEPDIVKTDGNDIYFSPENFYYYRFDNMLQVDDIRGILPPTSDIRKLLSIKVFPPADLDIQAKIDNLGSLLLTDGTLVVFSNSNEITGYNVSDPASPKEIWNLKLNKNNYIVQARLSEGKIYAITQQYINHTNPCPVRLFEGNESSLIPCGDIYYPALPISADVTFSTMILDPKSGEVVKKVSFVGSSGASVIYMSDSAIYATYQYDESIVKFSSKFLKEKFQDVAPVWFLDKVSKLDSYDISESSKIAELQFLWNQYINSLDDDEALRVRNELTNRLKDYFKENSRDLERTAIAKINVDDLSMDGLGSVPGHLLNQFALDEYLENLRVATTVGEQFSFGIFGVWDALRGSENDIYILDKNLKEKGSIRGLGVTERIYSARFIQDKGYLVTFRQTDPFYVLDLSDPQNPIMAGELKIPGFSSYLHPISENLIVGIGQDGSNVKVSLFDVSSSKNPKEVDKYLLSEYWTDVSNTHRAFLMDQKHEIFFMPSGAGGYIFSYKGGELNLVRVVSNIQAKRAIFINDYLYIVGEDRIVVLNEADWQKINELELR